MKNTKILRYIYLAKMQNSPSMFHQNLFQSSNFQVYLIKDFPSTLFIYCG